MKEKDLTEETSIKITLGHLLLAWETLSDKFSNLRDNDSLSEEERRAIWGLADILEQALVANGITGQPVADWKALLCKAKEHIKTVPVDFLD